MDSSPPVRLVYHCRSELTDNDEHSVLKQSVNIRGSRSSSRSFSLLRLPHHKLRFLLLWALCLTQCLATLILLSLILLESFRTDLHLRCGPSKHPSIGAIIFFLWLVPLTDVIQLTLTLKMTTRTTVLFRTPGGYSGFQVTGMIEGLFWVWNFRFREFFWVGKFWQVFFWVACLK